MLSRMAARKAWTSAAARSVSAVRCLSTTQAFPRARLREALATRLVQVSPAPTIAKSQLWTNNRRVFSSSSSGGGGGGLSGLMQRLSSFLIGAGLMALGTQYYIYHEIHEGNQAMVAKQMELEQRLMKLEKKK